MRRKGLPLIAGVLLSLAGCTLGEGKPAPASHAPRSFAAPAAPIGWQQSGTIEVGGQTVPVYSEIAQGEGQSAHRMALNPATGKIQRFMLDETGNPVWKLDPAEPSAP